jgi:putative tryptophan/tyrosine transport system substrate-binding protein
VRRREVIAGLGCAAAGWPLSASAEQVAVPVIGILSSRSLDDSVDMLVAFRQGLSESGFFEHQNVAIEYRWADGQYERLPAFAADLVRRQAAAILAGSVPSPLAAKAATSTIPIVFVVGGDPIKFGLVASLSQPGANVTGVTVMSGTLTAKRLELLRELAPNAGAIACLVNPNSPEAQTQLEDIRAAAHAIGQDILTFNAANEREIDSAFAKLATERAGALLVGNDALFVLRREQIVALAARHAVPAMYFLREFVTAGGLASYGTGLNDAYLQVGNYVGKILKGSKPADLPVQQTAKIELVVNLKTATALGLTIPPTLLARADEVIE